MTTSTNDLESRLGIPGRVTFQDGQGELPTIGVRTPWSDAEVYVHGAHVTHFQRRGEAPLLFMSKMSRFEPGAPIRGGVPLIFPWFGPREGHAMHGYARIKDWDLKQIALSADGSTRLHFRLPDCAEAGEFPAHAVDYFVTIGETLSLELSVANTAPDRALVCEPCLHTYFAVGDINAVEVSGLRGADYLDSLDNSARKTEIDPVIRIAAEVDRTYVDTTAAVEIVDRKLQRRIRVAKEGSRSTVVWNPWIAKSQRMPDFGNEEYLEMICVESGNVRANRLEVAPGTTATMKVVLSSSPL